MSNSWNHKVGLIFHQYAFGFKSRSGGMLKYKATMYIKCQMFSCLIKTTWDPDWYNTTQTNSIDNMLLLFVDADMLSFSWPHNCRKLALIWILTIMLCHELRCHDHAWRSFNANGQWPDMQLGRSHNNNYFEAWEPETFKQVYVFLFLHVSSWYHPRNDHVSRHAWSNLQPWLHT